MRVVVSIAPLEGLVKPLLPADADLRVLIAPGRSEHGYELTAGDAAALVNADLAVTVGLGLESQVSAYLRKHPSPHRREVVFADVVGIATAPGEPHEEHAAHHHADGGDDDDDHGGVDPHLWLDPPLVRELVLALPKAVEQSLKDQGQLTQAAQERLIAAQSKLFYDVGTIDEEYTARLHPFFGQLLVTHHAAWKRLAERYGLKIAAVIRPIESAEPTAEAIAGAVHAIQDQHIPVIFVEPQFSSKAAERIAAQTGVRIGHLDPLGDGDWFKLMRSNLDSLVANLAASGAPASPAPLRSTD